MSNNFTNNLAFPRESLSLDPNYHVCSATTTIYHLEHFCFEGITHLYFYVKPKALIRLLMNCSLVCICLAQADFFRAWPNLGRYILYQDFFHYIILQDEKYY